MLHDTALVLHIAGGSLAIVAGYAGLTARKGGRTHQRAGLAFVVAMLVLVASAVPMAVTAAQPINILASGFAAYLVLSGWQAVRRPAGQVGRLELAGFLFAAGVAAGGGLVGLSDAPGGMAAVGFVFGAVAALGAALDLKVLRRGGLAGSERVRRHLWRMCAALFVATGSFFLGQMDEIPQAFRGPHLWVLALAPLAALAFWMARTRRRRRPATAPAPA